MKFMKLPAFLVVLLCTTSQSFAQSKSKDVKIKWAEQSKSKSRFADINRFFRIGEDYFAYKSERKGFFSPLVPFIEKYNGDLKYVSNTTLPKKNFPDGRVFESILDSDNKIFVFSSLLDNKANTKTIYFQTINPKTNKINNDLTKLTTIEVDKKAKRINYDVYRSEDEKKLVVVVHYPIFTFKETQEKFGVFVYNSDMKKLWEIEEYTMKYTDKEYTLEKFIVSNEGDIYTMGSRYVKNKEARSSGRSAHDAFELTTFTEKGKTIRSFPIKFKNYYINDFDILVNDNGMLAGAGFYSNDNKGSGEGAFIFTIDPENGELKEFKNKEFSLEFLKEGQRLKTQKKIDRKTKKGKDQELPNLDVREIVFCKDGSYRLIGEQYLYYVTTYVDANGNVRSVSHYVYGDIIVVNIDANKEITWFSKIPKYQHSTNDGGFYSSYALGEVKGKLVFLFNDHIDNLIAFKEKKGYRNYSLKKKKGIVVAATITKTGESNRELVYTLEEDQAYLRPKAGMQINENELVVFARLKKKGYKIGRVALK